MTRHLSPFLDLLASRCFVAGIAGSSMTKVHKFNWAALPPKLNYRLPDTTQSCLLYKAQKDRGCRGRSLCHGRFHGNFGLRIGRVGRLLLFTPIYRRRTHVQVTTE